MVNQVSTTQIEDEFQRVGNEVTERSAGADIQPPTREQLQGRAPGSPPGPDHVSMTTWGHRQNNFVNREYFALKLDKQQIADSGQSVEQSTKAQESQQQQPPQSRGAEAAPAQDMPSPRTAAGLTQQQTSQALGVSHAQAQGKTAEAALAGYVAGSGGDKEHGGVTQSDRNLEAYSAGADAKERQAEGNAQRTSSVHDQALEAYGRDPSAGKSQDIDRSDRNLAAQYDAAQANDRNAAQRGNELDL